MRIGAALPVAWLAGVQDSLLGPGLGPPSACLRDLRRAGVSAIELRTVQPDTPPEQALAAARQVIDAGLGLTVHGALPPRTAGPAAPDAALSAVLREVGRRGGRAMVTLHGFQSKEEPPEALAEASIRAVREFLRNAEDLGLPLSLALELNRAKEVNDAATTYDGLLAMVSAIDHPAVGFCWDLGHTAINARRVGLPLTPPDAFLRRVVHTHIHGLGPGGQTHWPLRDGALPLPFFLELLRGSGYAGDLTIELEPPRFAAVADVHEALFASVANLLAAAAAAGLTVAER